jgi:pimeloyl-ACP methyl ester carboxylesterase
VILAAATAAAAVLAAPHAPALTLKACTVEQVAARCGTFVVPENRAKPDGRTIGLRVVVIPARRKPARPDAFTFIAGGPGSAATDSAFAALIAWNPVHERHDLLFVDQRGTGGSNAMTCASPKTQPTTKAQIRAFVHACVASVPGDVRQYGTRTAMDDLDAVRAALGYEQLDVYGGSYGATAAQVYLKRHPSSVRTLVLDGSTAIDVPFYGRFAVNAEHALADVAKRCAADVLCAKAFPRWRTEFHDLVAAWDTHPARTARNQTTTGTGLAGIVQTMLLDAYTAASIPLVVDDAAHGDYGPLNREIARQRSQGNPTQELMYWSIWCNEPWVGLGATGPWHTDFDGYTTSSVMSHRVPCAFFPKRAEPAADWTSPRSSVPVLVLAGGADPQDPLTNMPRLKQDFPNSRAIVVPHYGHTVGMLDCVRDVVSQFVVRGTVKGLDTACVGAILPPALTLRSP